MAALPPADGKETGLFGLGGPLGYFLLCTSSVGPPTPSPNTHNPSTPSENIEKCKDGIEEIFEQFTDGFQEEEEEEMT
ncbi:hypothetical protein ACOMHN_066656 [Nucella lapillus]